jgi:hypothetical protein
LAPELKQVAWLDNVKSRLVDKYDSSSNPKEFIQVYHTVIEDTGENDRLKANYLPTALFSMARSWLVNLPEGTMYNWDQLCAMFNGNYQGTYERRSTTETIKHKA